MRSSINETQFQLPCSRLRIQLLLDGSPGFDAQSIVHSDSQALLTADVALRCLNGHVPKKEVNLLKLATGIMAKSRTRAAKVMRCKTRKIHTYGGLLDNVPDRLF
jgi:hypothetical protein